MIIGANSSEFCFIVARDWDALMKPFGTNGAQAEAAYDRDNKKDVKASASVIGADKGFVEPARFTARRVRASGQPVFLSVIFTKTGDPNGAGLPQWPVYKPEEDVVMDFSLDGPKSKADPWKGRLDLIEKLAADTQ